MAEIDFNGQTYRSVEDMPPEARRVYTEVMAAFADRDGNGVPDVFETGGTGTGTGMTFTSTVIEHDGRTYTPETLPPELRASYDRAMARLAGTGPSGTPVPDPAPAGWTEPPLATSSPVIQEGRRGTSPSALVIGLLLAVVVLVVVVVALLAAR